MLVTKMCSLFSLALMVKLYQAAVSRSKRLATYTVPLLGSILNICRVSLLFKMLYLFKENSCYFEVFFIYFPHLLPYADFNHAQTAGKSNNHGLSGQAHRWYGKHNVFFSVDSESFSLFLQIAPNLQTTVPNKTSN